MNRSKTVREYLVILLGSVLYALSTHLFIFPAALLLGGTSGVSVILNAFIPFSAGSILTVINVLLLIAAFFILGKGMAVRTFVGSTLTTIAIGILDAAAPVSQPLIANPYAAGVVGAGIIAMASAMLFYVHSSSGGTDIIALIVKKYSNINIGRALLITDFLIVIGGGLLSEMHVAIASFIGLLIKTFGIDFLIARIEKLRR